MSITVILALWSCEVPLCADFKRSLGVCFIGRLKPVVCYNHRIVTLCIARICPVVLVGP